MKYREQIAIDRGIDNTLSLLLDGYLYVSNRTKKYNRNMFETRLLGGKKVICMIGRDAAEIFYDQEKCKRHGATPQRVLKTLFGEKGLQTLDGATHRARKALFMSLMTEERLTDVQEIFKEKWRDAFSGGNKHVNLYQEAKIILMRTACTWAGVPIAKKDEKRLTNHLASIYEAGGAIGTKHWYGRYGRQQVEGWLRDMIQEVRQGKNHVPENCALHEIAFYRDLDGQHLDLKVAAVEVINILRPIVAIAVYIVFCALALHQFPMERVKLQQRIPGAYRMFVQEVRRYYPFLPFIMAKVSNNFFWKGHDFKKGVLVILDLYGTNHDPELWENPNTFNPERFQNWEGSPFAFIPQGGADHYNHHRCPGEELTIRVMETCLEMLVNQMNYHVPPQNLHLNKRKIPCIPQSGFRMENVQFN